MTKYPCLTFFKNYVRVAQDIRGALFILYARQRTQKNNNMNRFHRIGQKKSTKNLKKKIGIGPLKVWLSTPIQCFLKIKCESRKTFEGHYLYCLHVKEPKKNNIMKRFHRTGSRSKSYFL